jgi:signal transduction histidine kinase
MFRGEKQDLEELLGNLMDNASKWSTRKVKVSVSHQPGDTAHPGQWFKVTIEDDGPGVPENQRSKMMKRGQRLDESKPGSGLGLSIVTDLVTSYRGRLNLSVSAMGGLKVELLLPAARA